MKNAVLTVCAVVVALAGGVARGGFVNGVEQFNGTDLDLATWDAVCPYANSSMSIQNGGLTLHGQADITTRTITVGAGDMVRATMRIIEDRGDVNRGLVAIGGLSLTNGSGNSSQYMLLDSTHIGVYINATKKTGWSNTRVNDDWSGRSLFSTSESMLNTTYILEINRTASDHAIFSIYDERSVVLGRYAKYLTSVPDELYVAVWSNSPATVEFDSITIPEPGTMAILALGGLAMPRRHRRQ